MDDGVAQTRGSLWSSVATLFATSSTLVCCAIPAMLVALGAGAALSSLVAVFPQVVWLSEHKEALFAISGAALAISGWMQWRNRTAPCPVDPRLRDACLRTRKASGRVYFVSLGCYLVGGWFAFVQPWLSA
ncbi:hypothetical protein WG902_03745 [Ramlibacter sp. PS3R-8]|uniref:hypothetical protein n=1 Tax=Ramlibacter sp. PS3R-8 TaxID=3133437 RepID=UPI00309E43AD